MQKDRQQFIAAMPWKTFPLIIEKVDKKFTYTFLKKFNVQKAQKLFSQKLTFIDSFVFLERPASLSNKSNLPD